MSRHDTTLRAGARLGSYEIIGQIGAGGMGEVYRAHDARLGRDVAIKVLPPTIAGHPDLEQRFEREAQALAALDHAHICSVFDVGREDGTSYLVMEHLEGETLAERLSKGALPLDQALRYGAEIADALDKAHRQGIVHRDLKPGNVMLTKGGAKLLDFGLAKLLVGAEEKARSLLTTVPPELTVRGAILGTYQYMAPEQLEGAEADARTDIFALGAVLYEMLTGKKAFEGESQASLISSIMSSRPPRVTELEPLAPVALDHVVSTCLAKDPEERWQSAADVERQLRWIAQARESARVAAPDVRRRWSAGAMAAGALVLAVIAMAAGTAGRWWASNSTSDVAGQQSPQRVSILLPPEHPIDFGWGPHSKVAISPDGAQIVYVGMNLALPPDERRTLLYVRSLDSVHVRSLPGTDGASHPFFSPDGRWVAFFGPSDGLRGGGLRKVPLDGGRAVSIVDRVPDGAATGVWLDDDTIIYAVWSVTGLQHVSADGGTVRTLTTIDVERGESAHEMPFALPGGHVLFSVLSRQARIRHRIEAVALHSGERRLVLDNAHAPHVLESGHLLFLRENVVLVAPFDPERAVVTGPPVPLADRIRPDGPPVQLFGAPQLAVSRSGTLAYVPLTGQDGGMLGIVRRDGTFEALGPPDRYAVPRVAPDGRYVAVDVWPRSINRQIQLRIFDITRGTTRHLPWDFLAHAPDWHPSGGTISMYSERGDDRGIFLVDLDSGSARLLVDVGDDAFVRNTSWSPDGRLLAYTRDGAEGQRIWLLTMDDSEVSRPLLAGHPSNSNPRFSPDGHWLAYDSRESGRNEVYVLHLEQGARWRISRDGGQGPVWARDGSEIYYESWRYDPPRLMSVPVAIEGETFLAGEPQPLFDLRVFGAMGIVEQYDPTIIVGASYDVLPDGRFVMIRGPDPRGTREIVLVQNFSEEARRLTGTR